MLVFLCHRTFPRMFPYQKIPENKITFIFVASHDNESHSIVSMEMTKSELKVKIFWRLKYTRHDVLWQNKNGTRLNVF